MHLHTLNPSNVGRASEDRAKTDEHEVTGENPFEPLVPVQGVSRVVGRKIDEVRVEGVPFARILLLQFGDGKANGTRETTGERAGEGVLEGRERESCDAAGP